MRTHNQLTLTKRYQMVAFLKVNYGILEISKELGVHRSTIYREIKRNGTMRGYNPDIAQEKAYLRRKYAEKKLRASPEMKIFIRNKLKIGWSPEQIYGYCNSNRIEMVCHETIYKYIAKNKKHGGSLYKHLRRSGKRRNKYGSLKRKCKIKNRKSIDLRPKIVDLKTRIGDWEADLIIGKNHNGAILTIVDRVSRYTAAKILPNKKAETAAYAIIELLEPFKQFVHTITVDNGSEFAYHEKISCKLNAQVYFANPYSPWERGANENTNGLIRQYIPKKSSFDGLTNGYLQKVLNLINKRPRKCLQFDIPVNTFSKGRTV